MRIALIADTFPPLRNSGAVQLRDLAREFVRQGHELTVLLPGAIQSERWCLEMFDGARVLRLKAPKTKDVGYVRRTLAELLMPFSMLRNLHKSPLADETWDGVIWYSPSIFHGPLARSLKEKSGCPGYLIVRDIFPEWAADMGLMGRGLPFQFFRAIARYQYAVADVIGVQTAGNEVYFDAWRRRPGRRLEVLQNWLDEPARIKCSIRIDETRLVGRKVFVYAGNMGVAQGMSILIDLAEQMSDREDIGFLFVGRGSHVDGLKTSVRQRQLENVIFFDEISPDEIPSLYEQCAAGIVSLDHRHQSHNIPGKFLTYMQSGLPVLANVNAGNDLASLIIGNEVGQVCQSNDLEELKRLSQELVVQIDADIGMSARCKALFESHFAVQTAVKKIISALSEK